MDPRPHGGDEHPHRQLRRPHGEPGDVHGHRHARCGRAARAHHPAFEHRAERRAVPLNQSGTTVTASIASGPSGATLGNATATTGSNGAASFSGLRLSGTAGSYTLRFEASGLATTTSGTISLSAGAVASLGVNGGNNQTATAGTAVATPPSVMARDASGNPVAGVSVTFAVATGGGSVEPTAPVVTGANGVAAATSWILGATAGSNTLTATAAGSGISGNPVTFTATGTAGAAARLSISTEPSSTAQSGVSLAQQPV